MKLSKRIKEIKPSAAVDLDRVLTQMKADGENIISLNAGQPDFDTPNNIVEACTKALSLGKTKYTSINGILELRKAICDKLKKENNICYEPENIVVTTGAKQALYNTMQVLLNKGDEVIIPTPCWVSYMEMVKLAQAVPIGVKTTSNYHLDLQAISKAISPKTKAIIINTPNNPTGAVYTEKELRSLAKIAVKNNITIISDEVYEKLIYDENKHFSIASINDEVKQHCVTINGFSKAYSMTGWRIGYVACPKEVALAICSLQGHTTSNSTTFVQWAAIEALNGPQASVKKMRKEFNKRREFVFEALIKIDGIKCKKPQGAFYIFPDISSYFGKKDSEENVISNSVDLCSYLLKDAKVAVLPGSAFEDENCIRIAYSNSLRNITSALKKVKNSLNKLR